MSLHTVFVCLAVFAVCTQAAVLPSYFTKCRKSDPKLGECIVQSANAASKHWADGDAAYHWQSINPLHVPSISIDVNGGLTINFTDVDVIGLGMYDLKQAKLDLAANKFQCEFEMPYFNIVGMYSINGQILILPISGAGPANVTYIKPVVKYEFQYEPKVRGKNTYIEPKASALTYTTSRVYFHLENLFNGDKALGDQMTKFLDENWKEVNGEIGTKLGEVLGQVITTLLSQFFAKVPLSELLDD